MAEFAFLLSACQVSWEITLIFLTIGSWHKGFDRLVKAVDELKGRGIITDPVVAQLGDGGYEPANLDAAAYYAPEDFVRLIGEARMVIAHAGMGTIIEALNQRKPVVVVPRKATLGEANTDHQFDTAKQLEAEGKVLVAYEVDDLPNMLQQAESFVVPGCVVSPELLDSVGTFIEAVRKQRYG